MTTWNCSQVLFLGLNNTFLFKFGFWYQWKPKMCCSTSVYSLYGVFKSGEVYFRPWIDLCVLYICRNTWELLETVLTFSCNTRLFCISPSTFKNTIVALCTRNLCFWKHASPIQTAIKCDQWKAPLTLVQRVAITSLAQGLKGYVNIPKCCLLKNGNSMKLIPDTYHQKSNPKTMMKIRDSDFSCTQNQ